MPELRQPVKPQAHRATWRRVPWRRPETYLCALGLFVVSALVDASRPPHQQLTARLYVGGVRLYQAVGRPLLRGRVQCRYRPTCSEYSLAAVSVHGIRRGLALTVGRIASCTPDVPLGTVDPVPGAHVEGSPQQTAGAGVLGGVGPDSLPRRALRAGTGASKRRTQ
jgi:putative membrane protein insertion efficiency factor